MNHFQIYRQLSEVNKQSSITFKEGLAFLKSFDKKMKLLTVRLPLLSQLKITYSGGSSCLLSPEEFYLLLNGPDAEKEIEKEGQPVVGFSIKFKDDSSVSYTSQSTSYLKNPDKEVSQLVYELFLFGFNVEI